MKIEIYGGEYCSPCRNAKKLCESKGLSYTFKDVTENPDYHKEVEAKLNRRVTEIPQIFINDSHIGGFTELSKYLQ